ncbi:Pr6Pr family membrane protein [Luteipulveratus mongoliensis]|uniref:Pr6Pr family membrane protein n=1 Tax=Luteipulveratus mongoliensis TaxID=571913 RepID=UPI000697AC8E|nr:Pr6Pr family membrane protein [Luteipulveratus mongoliensis]
MQTIHPGAVVGTTIWRLAIAACAFTGWWLYGHDPDEFIFLTQSGNFLASIVYALIAVVGLLYGLSTHRELGTAVIRGAMTVLLIVVGCTYVGVIGGDTSETKDLLTHVVTPTLVVIDWCFVGRSQNRSRWWYPFLWVLLPSIYLVWYSVSDGFSDRSSWGSPIYDFMDPSEGSYPGVVAGLVSGTFVGAFLLYGIAKLKASTSPQSQQQLQAPGWPQGAPMQQPYAAPWQGAPVQQPYAAPAQQPYAGPPAQQPYAPPAQPWAPHQPPPQGWEPPQQQGPPPQLPPQNPQPQPPQHQPAPQARLPRRSDPTQR